MAKYELGGKIVTEFVVLTAKMYLYRKLEKKFGDKRYKGFRKCLVAKTLRLITIRPVDGKTMHKEQMLFENKKHEVYTVNKYKVALSENNDKRLVKADDIKTLVRGCLA